MIKLVYCIRRRAEVPIAAFYQYWLEEHGPLVKAVAPAIRAVKYVQSHTIEAELNEMLLQSRGLAPAYDGITEVWWESAASFRSALATPEGQAAMGRLLDDEAKFIDFAQSRVFITEEHAIFG